MCQKEKLKGVERRRERLQGEYRRPLEKLDRAHHGTQPGKVGPLVRRLDSYWPLLGLVIGAFQEGSQDLHALLQNMADSKLKAKGLARGREGSNQEMSLILAGFRRELSMASVKAYLACFLDRVARVGAEHRLAAKRRAWMKSQQGQGAG